jgi:hypothetical protein
MFVVAALLPACWTGAVAEEQSATPRPPPPTAQPALRVTLERTACMGACPVYRVDIDGRQHLARFIGTENVSTEGARVTRVSDADIVALDRKIAEVRFFERSRNGMLPVEQTCTSDGTTTTCTIGAKFSICSDTSHAIITVRRGAQQNRVDDACRQDADLVDLATMIDRIASAHEWVGDE